MQRLLRRAAIQRNQRNFGKVEKIKQSYVQQYTLKRQISDVWARMVCTCMMVCFGNCCYLLHKLHMHAHCFLLILQIANRVVSHIFTYGSLLDASALLSRVLNAPEIRELASIGRSDRSPKYWQTVQAIIENVENYLTVLLQTKGPRTTVNARAFRTVLAACSGQNLQEQRRVHEASMILVCHA